MRCPRLLVILVAAAGVFGITARPLRAQADVIRGTILGPDKKPVENATITVSYYDGSLSREARTDKNGRFSVAFADGTGDYWVSVAALGYMAKRYEIKRLGDEDILIADATPSKNVTTLDLLIAIGPKISGLLTGDQKRMLPPNLAPLLDPKYLELIRTSTLQGSAIGAIIR